MLIWMAVGMMVGQKQAEKHKRPMVANNFCFLFSRLNQTLWSPGHHGHQVHMCILSNSEAVPIVRSDRPARYPIEADKLSV